MEQVPGVSQIRESINLTQGQFADWLGEGVATLRAVQFWEAGDRKVPAYVRRIIELSNISSDNPATITPANPSQRSIKPGE